MDIVFFGSSEFAVPALKALLSQGENVSCVVTQPDRKKGRGLFLAATGVKQVAQEAKLKIYQPQDINSAESMRYLRELAADLFVVVAYGQLLSQEVLNIPKIFAVNIHASLLPKYRGAAPVNRAIIDGERKTGVSIIKVIRKMDAGPLLLQKEAPIADEDTAVTLEERLADMGAGLLLEAFERIKENNYNLTAQVEAKATLAPKLKKNDGLIRWERSAVQICNLVRGCLDWPGAFTYYKGKLLKIYKARVSSQVRKFASSNLGEILEASKEGIVVFAGKGNIIIEELQIEGKRRMRVEEFIAGHKILPGEILGQK